ncbi:hypothetical protein EW053_34145 [Streptomyces sp. IB2014 016-6]|nr:hypothetical protein EW053_34145 [Streptomyces sp. IB2014 016-6]
MSPSPRAVALPPRPPASPTSPAPVSDPAPQTARPGNAPPSTRAGPRARRAADNPRIRLFRSAGACPSLLRITPLNNSAHLTAASPGGPPTAAVPTVSSLSPASCPTTGGTTVTLTGSNLAGVTRAPFGARPRPRAPSTPVRGSRSPPPRGRERSRSPSPGGTSPAPAYAHVVPPAF